MSLQVNCRDNLHNRVNISIIFMKFVNCPSALIISLIPIYFHALLASFINKTLAILHLLFQEIFYINILNIDCFGEKCLFTMIVPPL